MSRSDHHAVLVRTQRPEDFDIQTLVQTQEYSDRTYEKLGVDEARQINAAAYVRPSESQWQTIIVRAHFITLEAQNALLKVIEEPPESTRFIFLLPSDFTVLPTILSRCELITDTAEVKVNNVFSDFLAADHKDRLKAIDVAAKAKDTNWQRNIKNGLIAYIQTGPKKDLIQLEYVARLLLTRGASNKMLLEHVALTLPTSSPV